MAENKVKFGLKNVHVATLSVGETGAITFGTPFAVPGAVNLSIDAQGDETEFYADDGAYYVSYNNNGYSGSLELARVPDKFRQDILKETLESTDKILVEYANVETQSFALLYEVNGDQKAARKLFYKCTVSRPAEKAQTANKSKEPNTETLNITIKPLADGRVKAQTTAETSTQTYNSWFSKVWEPSAEA